MTGTALIVMAVGLLRGAPETPDRDPAVVLSVRASALATQIELAKRDHRYLVLDPEAGTLTLFHGAAPLRSWPVHSIEAGALRPMMEQDGWRNRRWDGARMEPAVDMERRVIVSDQVEPPDPAGAVDWVPPTPEEAVPAPRRFVVHYDGGLGLEVVASGVDSTGTGPSLPRRIQHRLVRVLPANWDRYRIRVRMDPREAGALYRALPDSTSLLALLPAR